MTYMRCINNKGYEASLTVGDIYKVFRLDNDPISLRVIDNEGEDYLYSAGRFEPVQLPDKSGETAERITVYLDPLTKGILRAEALAAQTSVSALLREWIDEHLDLPVEG